MNWSAQQHAIYDWVRAADATPGRNLVVTARAGTGKTTTGCELVARIPTTRPSANGGTRPTSILYCAFNKRIADELAQRLRKTSAAVRTLHALGFMYLRSAWGELRVDFDLDDDRIRQAAEALDGHSDDVAWDVRKALKKLIDVGKGGVELPTADALVDLALEFDCEVEGQDTDWLAQLARKAMELSLKPDPQNRVTFGDMLFVPVVNRMVTPLYDWVIVDEAQDMNAGQLEAARRACRPDGHIVVIGDDRQAIYGFRGADSGALGRMLSELEADHLKLTTTYRCGASIVAEAQRLVEDFTAPDDAPSGLVQTIDDDRMLDLAQPGDVILSRVNAPLANLCLRLIRMNKPARIEGKDIGAMLLARVKKLMRKGANSVPAFCSKVASWANSACMSIAAAGKFVERKCELVRDVEATLLALAEDAETIEDICRRCQDLFADVQAHDKVVTLSTVHKAKGLEWRRVFILQPTLYVFGRYTESAEEKNIHYVAVTRARSELYFVTGVDDA